ncbi:hypothetical protein NL676_023582 [Syzygium grande]|nr:hypothetical protein NL676_023582 [Syzygium grande]
MPTLLDNWEDKKIGKKYVTLTDTPPAQKLGMRRMLRVTRFEDLGSPAAAASSIRGRVAGEERSAGSFCFGCCVVRSPLK